MFFNCVVYTYWCSYNNLTVGHVSLFTTQASNTDALRLYQEKLNYHIERTVSSYYMDKEDGHLLLRRGLLKLWQDTLTTEPHLVGADELRFEAGTKKIATNSVTASRETQTSTSTFLIDASVISDTNMELTKSRSS